MLTPPDDTDVVTAIAGGNREALGELYDRYASILLALGQRVLGRKREAEDVLHDVFLEVWRKAGTYSAERGSVRTWLFLRMRSRCLDRLRSPGVARSTSTELIPEQGTDEEPFAVRSVIDRERLRAAVSALSDVQREVLELAYFKGLSAREIGEQLEIPTGTVKSRLAAAMRRLRDGCVEPDEVRA